MSDQMYLHRKFLANLDPIVIGLRVVQGDSYDAELMYNNEGYSAHAGALIEVCSSKSKICQIPYGYRHTLVNGKTKNTFASVDDFNKDYLSKTKLFLGDFVNRLCRNHHQDYDGFDVDYKIILKDLGEGSDLITSILVVNVPVIIDIDRAGEPIIPECVKSHFEWQLGNASVDGIIIESRIFNGNAKPSDMIREFKNWSPL